jgi:hypothetical protein
MLIFPGKHQYKSTDRDARGAKQQSEARKSGGIKAQEWLAIALAIAVFILALYGLLFLLI